MWHWYLGNKLLGRAPVREFHIHARPYVPRNVALFCPERGEIWARIFRPDADGWHIIARHSTPGFLLPFDNEWITCAPQEVLARELLLICDLRDPYTYELNLLMRNLL